MSLLGREAGVFAVDNVENFIIVQLMMLTAAQHEGRDSAAPTAGM